MITVFYAFFMCITAAYREIKESEKENNNSHV